MNKDSMFARDVVDVTLIENVHYSRENEAWLLGLVMLDNTNLEKITFIKSSYFYFDYHREIFEVMQLLKSNYTEINTATITGNLIAVVNIPHEFEGYTVNDYCKDILESVYKDADILPIAEVIKSCWQRRAFHNVMAHGLKMSTIKNKNINLKSINAYIEKLTILVEEEKDDIKEFSDHLGESINLIQSGHIAKSRISTGYPVLDREHRILNKGRVTVIGATTGSGKTAFGLNLAYNISRNNPCLFLTMEMREEEIIQRLWGISCGIELDKLIEHSDSNPRLSPADCEKMISSDLFDVSTLELKYQLSTVDDLFVLYHKLNKKRVKSRLDKIDVIFIDYIELFDVSSSNAKDAYTQYGDITQKLYDFAKQEHIAIVILAQLKREANLLKDGDRPRLDHIALSYKIVKIPDTVIFLSGKEELFATILKNRAGKSGEIQLEFNRRTQKITESQKHYEDYQYNVAGDR